MKTVLGYAGVKLGAKLLALAVATSGAGVTVGGNLALADSYAQTMPKQSWATMAKALPVMVSPTCGKKSG